MGNSHFAKEWKKIAHISEKDLHPFIATETPYQLPVQVTKRLH